MIPIPRNENNEELSIKRADALVVVFPCAFLTVPLLTSAPLCSPFPFSWARALQYISTNARMVGLKLTLYVDTVSQLAYEAYYILRVSFCQVSVDREGLLPWAVRAGLVCFKKERWERRVRDSSESRWLIRLPIG
jgi:hypothetical protein